MTFQRFGDTSSAYVAGGDMSITRVDVLAFRRQEWSLRGGLTARRGKRGVGEQRRGYSCIRVRSLRLRGGGLSPLAS